MRKELADKILQDYPELFAKTTPSVGDGWFNLVNSICDIIKNHLDQYPEEIRNQAYVTQIKEKFGTLRFYMNHEDDFMSGVIALAEYWSGSICEDCGAKGVTRNVFGWMRTLCDKCYKKAGKEREKRVKKYAREEKAREKKKA